MEKENSAVKKKISLIISVISYILLAALLVITVYLLYCKFTSRVPYFGNRAVIRIMTDSMEPVIPAGTFIIIEKCDPETLEKDDIITFYSEDPAIYGKLNTHRIYSIGDEDSMISTKGDNNLVPDKTQVSPEKVIGKYIGNLTVISGIMGFIGNPIFLICALFALAVLCVILKATSKKAEKKEEE